MLPYYRRFYSFFALLLLFISSCENGTETRDEVLMQVVIPSDYLAENTEMWVFLSDSEGNPIGSQKALNGTELVFKRPSGFNEETVTLNFYTRDIENLFSSSRLLTTYAFIKPTEITLRSEPVSTQKPVKETITIFIEGVPSGYLAELSGNTPLISDRRIVGEAGASLMANPTTDKVDLYAMVYNPETGAAFGKFFANVNAGTHSVISFDDLTEMSVKTLPTPGASENFTFQIGFEDEIEYGKEFLLHQHNTTVNGGSPESIRFYYDENAFDSYGSHAISHEGDQYFYNVLDSSEPPSQLKKLQAEITSSEFTVKDINLSMTGTADFVYTWSYGNGAEGSMNVFDSNVIFFGTKPQITYKYPLIPAEILAAFGHKRYPIKTLQISEYPKWASLDDFLAYSYERSTGPQAEMVARGYNNIDGNSGGRAQTSPVDPIEIIKRQHHSLLP